MMMRQSIAGTIVCTLFLSLTVFTQTNERESRARVEAFIQRQLAARHAVKVAADDIALVGDVVRLKGHVRIVCGDDTFITAEEATINRTSNRVELTGNLHASWGRSSGMQGVPPRVEYR